MNAGVRTTPCGVAISPLRAAPSVAVRWKENGSGMTANVPETTGRRRHKNSTRSRSRWRAHRHAATHRKSANSTPSFRARRGPFEQRVQSGAHRLAPGCQTVLNLRGHLRIDFSHDDPVALQFTQLLDQHLLGNAGNRPFQFGESERRTIEQMEDK